MLQRTASVFGLFSIQLALAGGIAAYFSSHSIAATTQSPPANASHEKLRFKNTFKTPEDVVRYYCARDASGFVYTGLLDVERRSFTLWTSVPEPEGFYVARSYKIGETSISGNKATIPVTYDVIALSDAFGTQIPPSSRPLVVTFHLLRSADGQWKIQLPDSAEIAPVVLQGRFATAPSN
jgi:hypothetical protein